VSDAKLPNEEHPVKRAMALYEPDTDGFIAMLAWPD
jgi:hypothetical protein